MQSKSFKHESKLCAGSPCGGVCCFFLSSNSSSISGSSESELKILLIRNLIHDYNESKDQCNVNPWKDCDTEVVSVPEKVCKCELSCHLKKNKKRNKNSFSQQEKVSLQQNSCIPWINESHFASSTSRLTYDEKRLRRVNCERQTDRGVFVSRTEHMAGGGLLGRWSRR